MPKTNLIIYGIDPDSEKNGVAQLNVRTKEVIAKKLNFAQVVEMLNHLRGKSGVIVVIEASWVNASNWHLTPYDSKNTAARKGYDVGRCHETGKKIVEMCEHFGVVCMQQRPLKKCWKGANGKITQQEITQFVPNLPKRLSQDERDAILLAWNYANLPIRIKV